MKSRLAGVYISVLVLLAVNIACAQEPVIIQYKAGGQITFTPVNTNAMFTVQICTNLGHTTWTNMAELTDIPVTSTPVRLLLPESEISQYFVRISEAAYEGQEIPSGVIVMWSGATTNIPAGWVLCDGRNGTPNLGDRFIVGATTNIQTYAATTIEGAATQNGGSVSHQHSGTTDPLSIGTTRIDDNSGGSDYNWMNPSGHAHTFTAGASNHLPPYYALAYIMKL